jgi:hypothetical protein
MSVALQINTFERGASDAVRELERELNPTKLSAVYGPRLREQTRDHLKQLPRNKKGWPSTNFWEQAARATRWEPRGAGVVAIVVDKIGVRQRYMGGPIRPQTAKALTIPISPLSYGKTAKDFPGSFILSTRKGAYIVMYGSADGKPTKPESGRKRARTALRATLIFLFKLSGGVDQKPDKGVLPTPAEYRATIFAAARERITAIKTRKGGVTA